MEHGRLPWYTPGELSAEQQLLYDAIVGGPRASGPRAFGLTDDRGRLEGPFNALLVSPEVGDAIQNLGAAIRYRTDFSARIREIAILELAALRRCAFEWYAHERVGRLAGLSDAEVDALLGGGPAPTLSDEEQLVRRLVRALVVERDLGDELFAQAQGRLGERAVMEIVALVGYYDLVALSLHVWRTPLPAGAESPFQGLPRVD
jgi:4-carboxymuconolactone decarboxylase